MNPLNKPTLWIGWAVLTVAMAAYLTHRLRGSDRTVFLPGATTHGHYQIELSCNACHTPWMGVNEQSCIDCHGKELKAANDSHPKAKFTDPRNADQLKVLNAASCITCHREHTPAMTRPMGVTLPDDYCYHCHQDTVKERESHRDYPFDSCATAGCHNYHDNMALYEQFLSQHLHQPKTKESARVPSRNLLAFLKSSGKPAATPALVRDMADPPTSWKPDETILHAWESTAHAKAGINCSDCHMVTDVAAGTKTWTDNPGYDSCASCHAEETAGFLAGRHGMRLAQGLSPMKPGMARLPMKQSAAHLELNCASCHHPHEFDTRHAAVESCLQCHDDAHSRAYKTSPHFALWSAETQGASPPGSGVSCATCHLPRETHRVNDRQIVRVQHNQNLNLRPNEKMIRPVCLECHGLEFTLDALADPKLIESNFAGQPSRHVESLDLVERRQAERTRNKN